MKVDLDLLLLQENLPESVRTCAYLPPKKIILESELIPKINAIKQKIAAQNTPLPPDFVIGKQVLERMVINKLQLQLADRSGITVSDEVLRKSMLELAQRNSMDFRTDFERTRTRI